MVGARVEVVGGFTGQRRVRYGGELWNARSSACRFAPASGRAS